MHCDNTQHMCHFAAAEATPYRHKNLMGKDGESSVVDTELDSILFNFPLIKQPIGMCLSQHCVLYRFSCRGKASRQQSRTAFV